MGIDLRAYLDRIGFRGTARPDLETLTALHWNHLQSVPFENLDIRPLGRAIRLDTPSLEAKIVGLRRGGFCYELNGLLGEALRQIGFAIETVSVQFVREDGRLSPPFDHMALVVHIPGEEIRYLADVGGGRGAPGRPLPLIDGFHEHHPETDCTYQLSVLDGLWRLDRQDPGAEMRPDYVFAPVHYERDAFASMCAYQCESPDSAFTKGPICSRNVPGGRISLTGKQLIHTLNGNRVETDLADDAAFHRALLEHFSIRLT